MSLACVWYNVKTMLKIVLTILLCALPTTSRAARQLPPALLDNGEYRVQQAVLVLKVSDGTTLFSHNANALLIPASLTKLITTAAVLDTWGAPHQFNTSVYYRGQRQGDRIVGDIVMVGGGDPYLISEKMWTFASHIKNIGINTIEGRIIIDNSLFAHNTTRSAAVSRNAYDAPVTAFGVNFNTVAVLVVPAARVGKRATVTLFPFPLATVAIDNRVRTVASAPRTALSVVRRNTRRVAQGSGSLPLSASQGSLPLSSSTDKVFKIIARGRIAVGSKPRTFYRSITQPQDIARDYVRNFLQQHNVRVLGKKLAASRAPRVPLHNIKSYPLGHIVKGLNTFSNNYIADMLIKKLGADTRQRGTLRAGADQLRTWLRDKVGITSSFTLKNGSGLTADNRLSAKQLAAVLHHAARHMRLLPDFLASLPASGLEGTVNERLRKHKGLIRAKTGTLTSPRAVAGLAGYYFSERHEMIAFVLLANGRADQAQPPLPFLRKQQDRLLGWLVDNI